MNVTLSNPNLWLTETQWHVTAPWLAHQCAQRRHIVLHLSGAHAYGFPSPDSDIDIKCVHLAPTCELVDLMPVTQTAEQTEIVDGVELDYSSNELGDVLRGIVAGNGNYVERFLGATAFGVDTEWYESLRTVVGGLVSQRMAKHYRGFAISQLQRFREAPSAKRALYVYRTALTGIVLLRTGRLAIDVRENLAFTDDDVSALLARKQTGERAAMSPDEAVVWLPRLQAVIAGIENAVAQASVPEAPAPAAIAAARRLYLDIRREYWLPALP